MSDLTTQGPGGDPNDVISRPLPPGVHPMDPSTYISSDMDHNAPVPIGADTTSAYRRGRPPFDTPNGAAVPVFQRAAAEALAYVVVVDANNGGTAIACARQKGRQRVTLVVPSKLADGVTVPLGVTWGLSEADVQNVSTMTPVLNPGDSVTIATEAPIWVGLITGNTSGAVMVIVEINPIIGGID